MQVMKGQVGAAEPRDMSVEIGRRTLRVLTKLLKVGGVLILATTPLAIAFTSVAVLRAGLWGVVGILIVLLVFVSLLLVFAPGIAFLIHSVWHREEGITQRLRYSATASAIAPGLLALLFIIPGDNIVGWILACVAAAVIVRAWTARRAEPTAPGAVLRYKHSLAGIGVFAGVLLLMVTVGRSHRYPIRVHTKSDAYRATMKYDLRSLVSAQEYYFEDHKRYTTDLAELGFRGSTGVNPPKVIVGQGWWQATNTHSQLSNYTCGIAVKTANPVVATAAQEEPACK